MASAASIAIRHQKAMKEVTEILEKHDPEVGEWTKKANHGHGVPSPSKQPLETAAMHAEALASLCRLIDEHLTPKKRGRPPKAS